MSTTTSPQSPQAGHGASYSKYLHEMNSEERLQSLKDWAEEKKYIYPGESGSLALRNGRAMGFGVPVQTVVSNTQSRDRWGGQYEAPVGPPSYTFSMNDREQENAKAKGKRGVSRWLEKRKLKKDAKRNTSVPAYMP